jgi:CRISPR-associated endonuclease/helicase Cas3
VNTVSLCQEIAEQYEQSICYHSRFTLDDRKKRHEELIREFKIKNAQEHLLCITTQVCEMSLDLDADILITEEAPITSLIQRMGRCNRRLPSGSNRIGQVYIYKPEQEMPYERDDWNGVEAFLNNLSGKQSQDDLNNLLIQFGRKEPEADKYAAFTESGPWAQSREATLRDESDYTVPAILDVDEYLRLKKEKLPTDGLVINVPKKIFKTKDYQPDPRLPAWLNLAPTSHYDKRLGFLDHEKGGE